MPEDIKTFESRYNTTISQNSCVIIKTGWEKFWYESKKYHNNYLFPSVSAEAADLLLKCGVAALGIDTLSSDRPKDGFKVHQTFLENNKILIENVANVDNMPPVKGYVMIFPIKVKDGTEAPIRLIGLINENIRSLI